MELPIELPLHPGILLIPEFFTSSPVAKVQSAPPAGTGIGISRVKSYWHFPSRISISRIARRESSVPNNRLDCSRSWHS